MTNHKPTAIPGWFHSYYQGEDRDDGCANELSLHVNPTSPRLEMLLTNVDFTGEGHTNTFSLGRTDVVLLRDFLQDWLKQSNV